MKYITSHVFTVYNGYIIRFVKIHTVVILKKAIQ